ncbi:MAG: hypothetical protein Greene101449_420 [Candidatus Peregrinibacteria bacterium Greene1014_49]|nr:MAG: hypothetical protein Greene101449_420 [Candidatus Peregrinibacteria bacterium Greene1014_49]
MSTMLPEDFKKLLQKSPEELAGLLGNGTPDSSFTFSVKSILDYKLQKGLLIETRKMAWATIVAVSIPTLLSIFGHFIK